MIILPRNHGTFIGQPSQTKERSPSLFSLTVSVCAWQAPALRQHGRRHGTGKMFDSQRLGSREQGADARYGPHDHTLMTRSNTAKVCFLNLLGISQPIKIDCHVQFPLSLMHLKPVIEAPDHAHNMLGH